MCNRSANIVIITHARLLALLTWLWNMTLSVSLIINKKRQTLNCHCASKCVCLSNLQQINVSELKMITCVIWLKHISLYCFIMHKCEFAAFDIIRFISSMKLKCLFLQNTCYISEINQSVDKWQDYDIKYLTGSVQQWKSFNFVTNFSDLS